LRIKISFSRNAKIRLVNLGIDSALHEKRISPARIDVKNKEMAANEATGRIIVPSD
jgi:hypothetical protein